MKPTTLLLLQVTTVLAHFFSAMYAGSALITLHQGHPIPAAGAAGMSLIALLITWLISPRLEAGLSRTRSGHGVAAATWRATSGVVPVMITAAWLGSALFTVFTMTLLPGTAGPFWSGLVCGTTVAGSLIWLMSIGIKAHPGRAVLVFLTCAIILATTLAQPFTSTLEAMLSIGSGLLIGALGASVLPRLSHKLRRRSDPAARAEDRSLASGRFGPVNRWQQER